MKKTLLVLLALMLALSMALPAMAEGNAARERVSIRYAQFGNSTDDVEGMEKDPIKKAIEDAVNVDLEYDTGTDGFIDRMETELFTGGAAELFCTFGEPEKIKRYVEEELVYDLGAIVNADPARYPTLAKIMAAPEYKAYNKLYTGDPEKAYAIYSIFSFANPIFGGVPAYNKAILDEVNGGKVPATLDEFTAFMKACAEKGYVGYWPRNSKLTDWTYFNYTFGVPMGTSIMAPAGDVWTGFVQTGELGTDSEKWELATVSEKSKEVVKLLADLYAAGALDKNLGIKGDFDDAYSDFSAGKIAAADFGFGFPTQFADFYGNPWKLAHPDATTQDLVLGTALTVDGKYGDVYSLLNWMSYQYFIPTSCTYPDRVLDLVEFLASAAGQDLIHNTTNYVFREDQGPDFWNEVNKAYGYGTDGRCKYVWFTPMFAGGEYEVDFTNREWWDASTHPIDNSRFWETEERKQLIDYSLSVTNTFVGDLIVDLPQYYTRVQLPAEAGDIRAKLTEITNQYLTQMIGGQLDIEEGWAKYQAEYEAAGAAKLEQMVNEAIAAARAE